MGSGPATSWVHSARLPAKPAGLTATPGDKSVTLTWTAPSPAEPNIARRQYQEGSNSWTDICVTTGDSTCAARTSFLVTGLVNGTNYTFKIRAVNAGGNSEESNSATAIPGAAPAKPAGFTAAGGAASVVLSWTNPNDNSITAWEYRQTEPKGGLTAFANSREVELSWDSPSDTTGIARWQVRYRKSAGGIFGAFTDIAGSGPATSSHTVTGLGNGTEYELEVRARTASTTSGGLTAVGAYKSVHLFWSKPGDTSSIQKWQYRYKSGGSYGPWTLGCEAVGGPQQIAECKNRISFAPPNLLTNGTAYTFQVRALDSSDALVGSVLGEVTATPLAAAKTLGPVSATPSASGGWTAISGSGASTVTHTVTSLTNDTLYTFQVRARRSNAVGPASAFASATPAALPAKPTGLTAASGENEAVTLSWPTSNAASAWEYSKDDGSTWTKITTPTTVVGTNRTLQGHRPDQRHGLHLQDTRAEPQRPGGAGLRLGHGNAQAAPSANGPGRRARRRLADRHLDRSQ